MIDFDEEIKNFQPSLEIEEAEASIHNSDLTDMVDILRQIVTDDMNRNAY